MVRFVEIAAVVLVAITMALTLAHALELPGKLRLDREQYFAVQTIYYPGFTIGGGAEILGILVLAWLLCTLRPSAARASCGRFRRWRCSLRCTASTGSSPIR
jgi:hypothetical protein